MVLETCINPGTDHIEEMKILKSNKMHYSDLE
jgi:hypothetical protein